MGWHQASFDDSPSDHWQLHAHFLPPLLDATKRKFARNDFRGRGILGLEPKKGVLAIGATARRGQTVQFLAHIGLGGQQILRLMAQRIAEAFGDLGSQGPPLARV